MPADAEMPLTAVDLPLLSSMFDAVAALGTGGREAWFAALPDDQRRLEPALRQMLERQAAVGRETDDLVLPQLEAAPDAGFAYAGSRIGPYVLDRELGRGGMGTVWLAERADGSLKRQVALKLPCLAWDRRLAERMARERDIGAILAHPHIARLYDAGVDSLGRPYLAFEYVDGVPIDAYCDERQLDIAGRLRLFVQVARAVAYAHGRLVVHRDLKPSNVLVSEDGEVHLLDFGIARLVDDAGAGVTVTLAGRAMTPQYASPEQMSGEAVTVQSDVYSLGVLLFELLTGRLPGAPADSSGDPLRASSMVDNAAHARRLRGELDAILSKAMRRAPEDRYATADALAQDVESHLAGEAVSARPDSLGYRLGKLVRRYWLPLGAGSAVVVAVLAAGSVAVLESQRAARQAERVQAVTAYVSDLFQASIRPQGPGQAPSALENGAHLIAQRLQDQPDIQSTLYSTVAKVYADIGAYAQAGDFSQRALALLEQGGRAPSTAAEAAKIRLLIAHAALGQEDYGKAEQLARQAVGSLGPDDKARVDLQVVIARAAFKAGQQDRAREALDALERQPAAAPGRKPAGSQAWALWLKGEFASDMGQALELLRAGLRQMEIAEGPAAPSVIEMQLDLGRRLLQINQLEEGKAAYEHAVATLRSLGGPNAIRAELALANFHHVRCYMGQEPQQDSVVALERARAALSVLSAVVPAGLRADVDLKLANCRTMADEFDEAQRLLAAAAPSYLGAHPTLARQFTVESLQFAIHEARGEHAQAIAAMRRVTELRRRMGNYSRTFEPGDWIAIAHNHLMAGELAEAEAVLAGAPAFEGLWADPVSGGHYSRWLPIERAWLLLAQGKLDAALAAMPPSLEPELQYRPPHNEPALRGEIFCAGHRKAEGLALLQESIQFLTPSQGKGDLPLARMRAVAGLCALALGRREAAVAYAEAARLAFALHSKRSPWFEAPQRQLDIALGRH